MKTTSIESILAVAIKEARSWFNSHNEHNEFIEEPVLTLEEYVKWWEVEVAVMQAAHDKESTIYSARNLLSYKAHLEGVILLSNQQAK